MNSAFRQTNGDYPSLDVRPEATGKSTSRYPDFLIIGAARSGTTTLATLLAAHPEIFMCDPKEPFFFSHQDVYVRGTNWYCHLFAHCRKDQICGEASTSYSVWPECGDVASRIAKTMPRVKLIYILRHPVDRAYSHYDYDLTRLGKHWTFEEALARNRSLVYASLYMQQIRQYLSLFDRSRLLCLLLEDLKANPEETLSRVWQFLGVAQRYGAEHLLSENSADEHFVRVQTTQKLRALPGVSFLADRVPKAWRDSVFRQFKRSPIYRLITRQHNLAPMLPETREWLLQRFAQPNRELAEFLQRDLSGWSI